MNYLDPQPLKPHPGFGNGTFHGPRPIYKYLVPVPAFGNDTSVLMPAEREILHVGQDPASGGIALWASVDPESEMESVGLSVYPTGYPVPETNIYLGTAIVSGGIVIHVHLSVDWAQYGYEAPPSV